jgi:hypothetical protein
VRQSVFRENKGKCPADPSSKGIALSRPIRQRHTGSLRRFRTGSGYRIWENTPLGKRLIEQYRAIEVKTHAAVTRNSGNWTPDSSRGVDRELHVRTGRIHIWKPE